jgi:hypothetical protein
MKVKYRMIRHGVILVCLGLTAMLFPVTPASTAFPGQNGSIALRATETTWSTRWELTAAGRRG